jgi:hypothetical protein
MLMSGYFWEVMNSCSALIYSWFYSICYSQMWAWVISTSKDNWVIKVRVLSLSGCEIWYDQCMRWNLFALMNDFILDSTYARSLNGFTLPTTSHIVHTNMIAQLHYCCSSLFWVGLSFCSLDSMPFQVWSSIK